MPESDSLERTSRFMRGIRYRAFNVPPRELLSDWIVKNRVLASDSSSIQGPYSFALVPYLREITNSIMAPRYDKVAIMGPSRCGKTEAALLSPIAYVIDCRPAPILVLIPKSNLLKKFHTAKLDPMLRSTPCLRGKIGKEVKTLKDRAHNASTISFIGGALTLANANVSDSYRVAESWLTLIDEADEGLPDIDGQGSMMTLAETRGRTFPDSKIVVTGSPTIEEESIIESECKKSTDEYYHVPCPGCGVKQRLIVEKMVWKDGNLRCEACHRPFSQFEWQGDSAKGEWIITNGNPIPRTRSFRIDGLLSPWLDWVKFVSEWQAALELAKSGSIQTLKTLKNTSLGIVWEKDIEGKRLDFDTLFKRREIYFFESLPDEALALTAAVDTQDDWLAYSVWAWGLSTQAWLIEYGVIEGNPEFALTWGKLNELTLDRIFGRGGDTLKIARMFVDIGGHKKKHVDAYAKTLIPRVYPIRGSSMTEPAQLIKTFPPADGAPSHKELDTNSLKDELSTRLNVAAPGPSYFHFPVLTNGLPARGADENYFRGLTAEYRKSKRVNNLLTSRWEAPSGARVESWDTLVYAYACLLDLGGPDYLKRLHQARGADPDREMPKPRWAPQQSSARAEARSEGTVRWGAK